MPRLLPVLLVALLAPSAVAQATIVRSGEITVGEGANGVTMGMSRADVQDELGRPEDVNPQGVMFYEDFLDPDNTGYFDVNLTGRHGTVDSIDVSFVSSSKWTLDDGNKIFKKGGIRRLFKHYGDRVHEKFIKEDYSRYYVIRSHRGGHLVKTAFSVDRFSRRKAKVFSVGVGIAD